MSDSSTEVQRRTILSIRSWYSEVKKPFLAIVLLLFEKLHAEGNTIIVVTHEPDIAARAHRVISIRDGIIDKDERIR